MVLAREMDMNQVADIYRRIQEEQLRGPKGELIRIEMFAHGALCMAVSGKCYLSLHEKMRRLTGEPAFRSAGGPIR